MLDLAACQALKTLKFPQEIDINGSPSHYLRADGTRQYFWLKHDAENLYACPGLHRRPGLADGAVRLILGPRTSRILDGCEVSRSHPLGPHCGGGSGDERNR